MNWANFNNEEIHNLDSFRFIACKDDNIIIFSQTYHKDDKEGEKLCVTYSSKEERDNAFKKLKKILKVKEISNE